MMQPEINCNEKKSRKTDGLTLLGRSQMSSEDNAMLFLVMSLQRFFFFFESRGVVHRIAASGSIVLFTR